MKFECLFQICEITSKSLQWCQESIEKVNITIFIVKYGLYESSVIRWWLVGFGVRIFLGITVKTSGYVRLIWQCIHYQLKTNFSKLYPTAGECFFSYLQSIFDILWSMLYIVNITYDVFNNVIICRDNFHKQYSHFFLGLCFWTHQEEQLHLH